MSRVIKTAAAAVATAPAQRLWQEFEIALPRPPGVVRGTGARQGPGPVPAARPPAAGMPAAEKPEAPVPATAEAALQRAAAPAPSAAEAAVAEARVREAEARARAAEDRARQAEARAREAEQLRQRLEAERRSAYEAGRADGTREALAALEHAVRSEVEGVRAALEAFIAEERAYRQRLEQSLVDLALAVAEKLVRGAIAADPTVLLPLVAEAAGRLGHEQVRVRAHAREAEALARAAAAGGPLSALVIEADAALEPGDVILESPRGRYDLRPATLLARVRRRLEDEVRPS